MFKPSWGMSRSRKVSTKLSRHSAEAAASAARKLRGKPPRSQSVCHGVSISVPAPTSPKWKPDKSTMPTRPASVSDVARTMVGDALPSSRKRVSECGRSSSTRKVSNNAGCRCTSSITTKPDSGDSICSGDSNRRRSTARSKSKKVTSDSASAIIRASVDLPHCRGPTKATAG